MRIGRCGGACAHLFLQIISAGEDGGCLAGAADEVRSPSVPSRADFFCLFFFLVMLARTGPKKEGQQLGG